jgi:hypothetical protein
MPTTPLLGSYGDISGSGLMFRNVLVNGGFDIWQRGTSFTPANNDFTADRFRILFDGSAATRTISRQRFTSGQTDVPNNPRYFLRWAQTVAGSGGSYNLLNQRMEGGGTLAGETVTLSFYAKAGSSLSLSFQTVQNFGTGGSAQIVTAISGVTIGTSWARYSVTFKMPAIDGKTFGSADDYLGLDFLLPINTTFTFEISNIQLEAGPQATPFEQRAIGLELSLCRRYFAYFPGNCDTMPAYILSPGTAALCLVSFGTPLRTSPVSASMKISAAGDFKVRKTDGGSVAATGVTFDSGSLTCASVVLTGLSAVTTGDGALVRIENNGFIAFSAEL